MSLLKKSQLSLQRRALLLIAAAVLLLTPCVAAARFALTVNTQQEPKQELKLKQQLVVEEPLKQHKITLELERQVAELKQQVDVAPQEKRADIEAKLRDAEQSLLLQHKREVEMMLVAKERLAKVSLLEKLDEAQAIKLDRKPRLINHTEARYTDDAREKRIEGKVVVGFTVNHDGIPQGIQIKRSLYPSLDQASVEAVQGWRFEPAMKDGQPVSMWMEAEMEFNLYQDPQKKEEREMRVSREKEEQEKEMTAQVYLFGRADEASRRAEHEAQQKRDAILAGLARISMDHAIQIATSKAPGKVTECTLVGEHWEGTGELAKPSLVLYHVVVLSEEAPPVKTHVLINAMDGSVFRVTKEDTFVLRPFMKGEEEMTGSATSTSEGVTRNLRTINGGVLNGKAASLPAPSYPAIARAAHASGEVTVRVVIDGGGNIIEATPVSGHPLLQAAAQAAAREAKFTPTRLNGEPVAVSGLLVYNFVAQ